MNEVIATAAPVVPVTSNVNVQELLTGNGPFGPEEIRLLESAIVGDRLIEVRQLASQLAEELDGGERSKGKLLRAGVVHYLLGKHSRAEHFLSKLNGEGFAELYHGHTLTALGRYADAVKIYENAGKHGAEAVLCLLYRAGALRCTGDQAGAEQVLKQASSQGGATKAEYCYQMGCLLADRGDTFGAVEYFERAVDMSPSHTRALFWLAGENALRGNDDEAIRLYERALSKPPLHLGALINLGLLYEDTENYPAAAFCFRRVLEFDATHERAHLYLKDIEAAGDMYYDEDVFRNEAKLKQLLEIPVTDFELSVRSRNCLQKMGIRNLGDLTRVSEQDLLGGKNFGETSLQEIKTMMESKGLRLGQGLQKDKPREFALLQEDLNPQQQALLNRTVSDLNLSVRARKCMARLGISTLGELTSRSADELLESKNFGVTSLNEVRSKLADLGLKLRND